MYELKQKLRRIVLGRAFTIGTNGLVLASIVLLFVLRLVPFGADTTTALEVVDTVVLMVFLAEFLLRFFLFGREYFFRDFGWIDLLACVPLLAPAIEMTGQFRSLRLARIIRLVRIIRVMRLLRRYGDEMTEHMQMKTRFFLAISSISMLFLLGTAVLITLLVESSLQGVPGVDQAMLLDRIELVIMTASVLAALSITGAVNLFLSRLVTERVERINEYLDSMLAGGNKLPYRPDAMGDEITDLGSRVSRLSNWLVF